MTSVFRPAQENLDLARKIEELSGEVVTLCEQCGICTTSCPMVEEMDISPASIMHLAKLGDRSVLESEAIWVCASCYTCTVRCPRGVDLAKVTEALRQMTLRKRVDHLDPREIDAEELAELPAIALVSALRKFTG